MNITWSCVLLIEASIFTAELFRISWHLVVLNLVLIIIDMSFEIFSNSRSALDALPDVVAADYPIVCIVFEWLALYGRRVEENDEVNETAKAASHFAHISRGTPL